MPGELSRTLPAQRIAPESAADLLAPVRDAERRFVRGVRLLDAAMQTRPRSSLAYYQWRTYHLTARGDVLLPIGYAEREPVPVGDCLASGPLGLAGRPHSR